MLDAVEEQLRETEVLLADALQQVRDAEFEGQSFARAWRRELKGQVPHRRHEIDALVAGTRMLRERLAAAEAELARYRSAEVVDQHGGYLPLMRAVA